MSRQSRPPESPPTDQLEQALSGLVRTPPPERLDMSDQQVERIGFGLRASLSGGGNKGFMDLALPTPHLTVIRGAFTLAQAHRTHAAAARDSLRIRLGLSGDLEVHAADGNTMQARAPGCLLAAQPQGTEFHYENQPRCLYRQVNLVLARGTLSENWGYDLASLPPVLQQFEAGELTAVRFSALPLSPDLIAAATDILECGYAGTLLDQYLDAKAREIICLIIAAHQPDADSGDAPPEEQRHLTQREQRQVAKARQVIDEHFASPPSIAELAGHVGLNRNKLCAGFQTEHGQTIQEYARELRLQKALDLLRQGDISITEVALEVGYGHSSSLTTAVKRRFGLSPRQLRQSFRHISPSRE